MALIADLHFCSTSLTAPHPTVCHFLVVEQLYNHSSVSVCHTFSKNSNISATYQQLQQQQQSDQFGQHLASVHVHSRTDIACTAHSFTVYERIFLKF